MLTTIEQKKQTLSKILIFTTTFWIMTNICIYYKNKSRQWKQIKNVKRKMKSRSQIILTLPQKVQLMNQPVHHNHCCGYESQFRPWYQCDLCQTCCKIIKITDQGNLISPWTTQVTIIISFVRSRVGGHRRSLSHNYSPLSRLNIANILNNFTGNISAVQISEHIVITIRWIFQSILVTTGTTLVTTMTMLVGM